MMMKLSQGIRYIDFLFYLFISSFDAIMQHQQKHRAVANTFQNTHIYIFIFYVDTSSYVFTYDKHSYTH